MSERATTTWPGVMRQALWFGLLTGLGEAGVLAVKQQVLGRIVRVGPDILWMAPVADALALLVVGGVLVAGARVWKPIGHPRVAPFIFASLGCLSLLLMYYPIELYAKILLAIGLSAQVARMATRWPQLFARSVHRGIVVAAVLVTVLAGVTRIGPWIAYRQHVSALPASPAGAPNVLLIVWDTVRAKNLSVYGYGRDTTPHLKKWAESGVAFDHASSVSPWTLPSHASMLTGQWPQELSTDWETPLDGAHRTLPETLSARGYLTAGFVANTYYCGHELGIARGFARYEDYVVSPQELLISSTLVRSIVNSGIVRRLTKYDDNIPRRTATAITDQFLDWHTTTGGRPFFAFLNFFDAHEAYLPPPPFAGRFGPAPPLGNPALVQDLRRSLRRDWFERPAAEIQAEQNSYDAAIAYLDDQLNRLLEALQARGVLDNTVVIVTSDHGEQFGEHGLFLHGNSLYQPLLHVPLVIRYPPSVPQGRRVAARASLRDLSATVVDLLKGTGTDALPGSSLARYWSTPPAIGADDAAIGEVREADWAKLGNPWYPIAKGDLASVTDDAYHYIRNGDGSEELYALATDPDEKHNLSGNPGSAPLLEKYRALLRATLKRDGQ